MLMTVRRHNEVISTLKEGYNSLLQSYISQIALQEERISDLRSLVFSPLRADDIPPVLAEADQIITQNEMIPDEQSALKAEELRERDRIFSGSYEELG